MRAVHGRRERAKELHERLRSLVAVARRVEAEIAIGLLELKKQRLSAFLGCATVPDYAERVLGIPRGKAKELLEIAERIEKLPKTAAAFRSGDLAWTKARQVVRAATAETEAGWLERAAKLTNRELEREVARARGERPKVRVVLELTEGDLADLDEAVRRLREERRQAVPLAEAVAELCRRAMGPPVDRPGYQVVIHECATCEAASRDARGGPIPVSAEEVQAAKIDAEVVDLREPGATAKKTIKPSERRAVIARDRGQCRICGTTAWLHIHHLERRHAGAGGLVLLCSACHTRLVHAGHVRIQGRAPDLAFRRADGTDALATAARIDREQAPVDRGAPLGVT